MTFPCFGSSDGPAKYGMAPERAGCYARGCQEAVSKFAAGRLFVLWQVDKM